MSEELKPLGCPHCGADLVLSPGNPTGVYSHQSGDLCFNGGIIIWSDDYDQITAWNRRSPLAECRVPDEAYRAPLADRLQALSSIPELGLLGGVALKEAAAIVRSPLVGSSLGSLAQEALVPTGGPQTAVLGWQPIETAPRDGTDVMLWSRIFAGEISGPVESRGPLLGRFSDGRSDYSGADWWDVDGGDAYSAWCIATHWMPLPPAPDEVAT